MTHTQDASPDQQPPAVDHSAVPRIGEVLRFSLPLMLGLMTTALNTFVDTLFIGQLGISPLAAVPLAGMIYLVGWVLVLGVMRNAIAFCARAHGAGRHREIGRILAHYHWIALAGLPLLWIYVQGWPIFTRLGNLSPEVAAIGGAYLNIRVWDVLFAQLVALYSAFYQSTGNSRFPMLVNVGVVVSNIVLDYLLIFGHFGFPALGVEGSALATVLAQAMGAALILATSFLGPMRRRYALRPILWPERGLTRDILRVGIPQGLGDLVELAAWGGFMLIVGWLGEKALAASNIGVQVTSLLYMPGFAFGMAAASYTGRLLGAERPDVARITARRIVRLGVGYMALMGLPLWFFGETLASLFTTDTEVIHLAGLMFKIMAAYQAFDGLGFITRTALTGAGDTLIPTLALAACAVGVLYPAAWGLTHLVEPPMVGAWLGAFLYMLVYAFVMHLRFRSGAWLAIRLTGAP